LAGLGELSAPAAGAGAYYAGNQIKYIGKESSMLEEVEAGLIQSAQNVNTKYPDPRRDDWEQGYGRR
jgi:hypothetical protein